MFNLTKIDNIIDQTWIRFTSLAGKHDHVDEENKLISSRWIFMTEILLPNGKKKTIRNVSAYYGVPRSTLADRKTGRYSLENPPKPGRKVTFSDAELVDIVNHLLKLASIGYGYTSLQTQNLLRYLALKCKGKPNFTASRAFLAHILFKFPELALRKMCAYDYQRAKSLTVEKVSQFFEIIGNTYSIIEELSGYEIDPKNIWSLDEVGFKLNDAKNMYIFTKEGVKNAHAIASSDKKCFREVCNNYMKNKTHDLNCSDFPYI